RFRNFRRSSSRLYHRRKIVEGKTVGKASCNAGLVYRTRMERRDRPQLRAIPNADCGGTGKLDNSASSCSNAIVNLVREADLAKELNISRPKLAAIRKRQFTAEEAGQRGRYGPILYAPE